MIHKDLFELCKRNDARAQRALYDLHKAKLMGLCRRYTRNRDDAKDMLQEAFIKIFTKIRQVETAEKLEAWMKSVVVRTAIDHYNKMKRIDVENYSPSDHDVPGVDYEFVMEHLSDEYLISAIHALPEGCRLIFNLYEIEGYSHTEIGELLGVSEGTSRSQLHHAKYLLKKKLNSLGINRYEKYA